MALLPLHWLLLLALGRPQVAAEASLAAALFFRQDFCSAQGLQSCPGNYPENFCCPSNSACIALANATTVLCCPTSGTCDNIRPIVCDLRAQDPARHVKAPVKTTVFDGLLQKCGSSNMCCPYGFSCSSSGTYCIMDKDQSKPPPGHKSSDTRSSTTATTTTTQNSASTPTTTTSSASSSSSTSAVSSSSTRTSQTPTSEPSKSLVSVTPVSPSETASPSSSKPSKVALIGGVLGGTFIGLLTVTAIVLFCVRRRRRHGPATRRSPPAEKERKRGRRATTSKHGRDISAPVLHPGSYRSDFLRRLPSSGPGAQNRSEAWPQWIPKKPSVAKLRMSIPNFFASPESRDVSPMLSPVSSRSHEPEAPPRTGYVKGAHQAPIQTIKAAPHFSHQPATRDAQRTSASGESIEVFADERTVHDARASRTTTLSYMLEQSGLAKVQPRDPYASGATSRF